MPVACGREKEHGKTFFAGRLGRRKREAVRRHRADVIIGLGDPGAPCVDPRCAYFNVPGCLMRQAAGYNNLQDGLAG